MKKTLIAFILTAAVCILCGCGSLFDREYVVVKEYEMQPPANSVQADRVTVRNFTELRSALLRFVSEGAQQSSILFSANYDGDAAEDLASACWQVRTQNALCAYCVENIAYELSKIVTYYEAEISISYSAAAEKVEDIVQMPYSTGTEEVIRTALEEGRARLVVLINRSSYSAEEMEGIVDRVYRSYPASVPKEPQISINMLSGTGLQRLYEIRLRYGLSAAELESRQEELRNFTPFAELDLSQMEPAQRALLACRYLVEHCSYTTDGQNNDVYSALIRGQANSEGMALAYVELCRQMEVPCQIVYGQRDWENTSWNIVELDGDYYHVDPQLCADVGVEAGFLRRDVEMWGSYRWDVSAYPACEGQLKVLDVIAEMKIDS